VAESKVACNELKHQINAIAAGQWGLMEQAILSTLSRNNEINDQKIMIDLINTYSYLVQEIQHQNQEQIGLLHSILSKMLEIESQKNSEIGINFLSNLMQQGIQNPDGLAKVINIFQAMQNSSGTNSTEDVDLHQYRSSDKTPIS
jgi:hypothetical protein